MKVKPKKIYLAGPYSHALRATRIHRFETSCRIAKTLMLLGYVVLSPVVHSHHLADAYGMPSDWDFWKEQDLPLLEWCDELWVIMLPGWTMSVGVIAEIKEANRQGKQIVLLRPDHE